MRPHTSKRYEAELRQLREKLLKMGARVEEMIAGAVGALVDRDTERAEEVIRRDREVDLLEMEVDELCVQILALRQPAAGDLRFLTMAMKIDTDLERMGDLASNIARRVVEIAREPPADRPTRLSRMAEIVRSMVDDALDAFVEGDVEKAQAVLDRDHAVDRLNAEVFDDLIRRMSGTSDSVLRDQGLISVSKHLERIADHATNIAEMVIFAAEGKDVRHGVASRLRREREDPGATKGS